MRLSLATRIFIGYAAVLLTFGAVSLFSVTEMHRSQEEIRLVSEGYLHLSQTSAAIESYFKNHRREMERLSQEKNFDARRNGLHLAQLYFPPQMTQMLEQGRSQAQSVSEYAPSDDAAFFRDVEQKFADLEKRFTEYAASLEGAYKASARPEVDLDDVIDRLTLTQNQIGVTINLLRGSLESAILQRVGRAQERERRSGLTIIALSILAIAVGLLATAFAARSLRPIRTLTEGVSRIGRGDYSAQVGFKGDDEIAVLAREFDSMARSLKEREAQLLQAERLAAMGKVAAQISHEIRNPLSSIGLNTEMLEELLQQAKFPGEAERTEAKELLTKVSREVDRLTEITEEYLRLARLPAPALKKEDLNQVLRGVLDFSREELERSNVRVDPSFTEEPVFAQADEGQLRQVLLNLVRNGREAMAPMGGGKLTLSTRANNGHVEIEVSDTGPGLTEEAQSRLFEPFFSTKPGGTGLGLSLSRQIVQAHGGKLEVERAEAAGARFRITLPRA
jgi:two-component system NtrC family sensor kinase